MKKILIVMCCLLLVFTLASCNKDPEPTPGTEPEVTQPEVTQPEDTTPEDTTPEATEPEDTTPEATEPEDTIPEVTEPEDTTPEATEPEDTTPEATEPEDTTPEATEPEDTTPEVTEPEDTTPEATEPEDTTPEATEPEDTTPEATEPEDTTPEATEPEDTTPEVTEPEDTTPEVTEPEDTTPEVTEPEDTTPEVTEPEDTTPEVTEPEDTTPEATEPEDTTPEATEPGDVTIEAELPKYQIFYPASDVGTSKGAATTLYDALKNAGHTVAKIKKDTDGTAAFEILIGATNREESATVLARLSKANEYAIAFLDNKIVIAANMKVNIPVALSYFLENYVNLEEGTVSAENGDIYIGSVEVVELAATEGKSSYVVVRSISGKYDKLAYDFLKALRSRTKDAELLYLDDTDPRPTGVNLILIGDDLDPKKYPEVEQVKNAWGFFDYGMAKVDNSLVIFANTVEVCQKAIELAKNQINRESEWVDGKLLMKFDDSLHLSDDRFLSDFPRFEETEQKQFYYNNDDEMVYVYGNVNKDMYDAYVAELTAAGFIPKTHTIGRNFFATCLHPEKGQVHIAFYPSARTGKGDMKLFTNKLQVVHAIPEDTYNPEEDKVSETIFHVMSLDYTHRGDWIWDGNGLCYIVTLEDGRFVVFDGGYDNCSDAENIYNYMKAVNPKGENAEIVIAAWFMSHSHADHHGAFDAFMRKYNAVTTIEYFVANSPTEEHFGEGAHWMISKLPQWLRIGNIKLIKPHTGQVLTFCGTDFEIVLSHEEVLGAGGNDASTVVRIHENGHTIMITADASTGMCGKMVSLYGDALKSDVLQLNHHGNSGGTTPFYQAVNPSFALWTTSEDGFSGYVGVDANGNPKTMTGRIDGGGNCAGSAPNSNKWIRDNVGKENCFVADDVIERILMPADQPLRILYDTGFAVKSNYPKQSGDGVLYTYEPEDPNVGVDQPDEEEPDTTEPEDTTPEVDESESVDPDVTMPEGSEPEVSDTETERPEAPEDTEEDFPLVEVPEIRDYRDLMAMKPDGHYKLMQDIDMSYSNGALRLWNPLGTESKPFSGTFDGNGFKITGFKIDASKTTYVGFFGYNTGIIKNVEFSDFEIKATHVAGMSVGTIAGGNAGSIINSYARDGKITLNLATEITNPPIKTTPALYVGGLVGQNRQSILNSYADCKIVVDAKTSETAASVVSTISMYAGGLIGSNVHRVKGCFAKADMDITMLTDQVAAQKIGVLIGDSTGIVENCYKISNEAVKITTKIHGVSTPTVATTPTGSSGTALDVENLMDEEWVTTNLWVMECDRWTVQENALPVLNTAYDSTRVIEISSWEDLKKLSGHLLSGNYKLTADIDCQGEEWTPISYFFGEFDGNGHTISNLSIQIDSENVGFIGFLAGTVKDLKLTSFQLTGAVTVPSYIGALVGYNVGTVSNCYVYNTLATETELASGEISIEKTSGISYIGGLVGYNLNSIVNCETAGQIVVITTADETYVGGLAGANYGAVQNSAANCELNVSGSDDKGYAGGLIGTNDGTVDSSYAAGKVAIQYVSSTAESYIYAGGLIGRNSSKVTNCYSTADVIASAESTRSTTNTIAKVFAGGLVGRSAKGTLTACYAAGKISGVTTGDWDIAYVGGVVGYEASGTIRRCFSVCELYGETAGASLQIGAVVGYSDSGVIEKGCYSELQVMNYKNSVVAPDAPSKITPNTLGEQRAQKTFVETIQLRGVMQFSDTYWNLVSETPTYPTLKNAGSTLH